MPPDLPAQHLKVALIGNPNTGKSTLFNALSGFRSQTGNYPGVTVEKKIGRTTCAGRSVDLIDLPGTYSLSPRTLDEMVAVDVLLGRQSEIGRPDVVVCIADASNLERNLYLACQVLDIGLPTILVLNMSDVASARGIRIDHAGLSQRLGIPVLCTAAHKQQGMDELREAIVEAAAGAAPPPLRIFPPAFHAECARLREQLTASGGSEWPEFLIER
ncbi:MAG: FeoB small GTPase domain-containing protein, partial [Planctomycetales bacterium]